MARSAFVFSRLSIPPLNGRRDSAQVPGDFHPHHPVKVFFRSDLLDSWSCDQALVEINSQSCVFPDLDRALWSAITVHR